MSEQADRKILVIAGSILMLFAFWMTSVALHSAEAHDALLETAAELSPTLIRELKIHTLSSMTSLNIALGVANGILGFSILLTGAFLVFRTPSSRALQVLVRRTISTR